MKGMNPILRRTNFRGPIVPTAWCAAARGTTTLATAARRTATTGSPTTTGTTRVSACPQVKSPRRRSRWSGAAREAGEAEPWRRDDARRPAAQRLHFFDFSEWGL